MQTGKRDVGNLLRRQDNLRPTLHCGGISDKRSWNLCRKGWRNRLSAKRRRVPSHDRPTGFLHTQTPPFELSRVCLHLPSKVHLGSASFHPLLMHVLLGSLFRTCRLHRLRFLLSRGLLFIFDAATGVGMANNKAVVARKPRINRTLSPFLGRRSRPSIALGSAARKESAWRPLRGSPVPLFCLES